MLIPTYICSYLPTYAHTYLRMRIPTYVCAYLPTYAHTYLPTYLPTYLHTYLPIRIPTYRHSLGKLCSISDLLFFLIVSHFLSLSLSLSNSKAEYHSSLINISYHSQTSASLSLSLSTYLTLSGHVQIDLKSVHLLRPPYSSVVSSAPTILRPRV